MSSGNKGQDGRVGLRRQFQVLVRKGMGSNPILDISFFINRILSIFIYYKLYII